MVLMQNHILNKILLNSPYKIIAADVNNDGQVSAIDLIRVKRLILGLDTTFTATKYNAGDRLWAFIDKSSTFSTTSQWNSDTNPFNDPNATPAPATAYNNPYINISQNNCNLTSQDFLGVKLGDVSYDWNPILAKVKPIEVYYNDLNATEQQNITIPVRVNNFEDMRGMQFSLSFDPTHFEFNSFENESLDFVYNADNAGNENNQGVISFVWSPADGNAVTLADGSVLFNLTLHKKKAVSVDDIVLTSDQTKVEAINSNLELIPITKKRSKIIDNSSGSVNNNEERWDILPSYSNMGNLLIKLTSNPKNSNTKGFLQRGKFSF